MPAASPEPADPEDTAAATLRVLLWELDGLLKRNSYQAKDSFERVRELLCRKQFQDPLATIQSRIDRMDFSGARQALQPLLDEHRNLQPFPAPRSSSDPR
jgi:hypothetical protein